MSLFDKAVKEVKKVVTQEKAFAPDGEVLASGAVRYKILCDGGINSSGVFFDKTVPAGASAADLQAAQAERDEAQKQLKALTGAV